MVASLAITQEQCNDIIHVWSDGKCMSVCDVFSCFERLRFDCSEYSEFGYIKLVLGYWYDNNVSHYTLNCPGEYCDFIQGWSNDSYPDRNKQCRGNWEGFVCGECKDDNSIIFDTMKCVPSSECKKYGNLRNAQLWLLILLTTLLYWCIFILLLVVVLSFKFDSSIGYAYGILFYYSVLENVVKQRVVTDDFYIYFDECDSSDDKAYTSTVESKILSSLTSIGSLKPPFLQFMKLCPGTQVIDHVFFVYIHPVIVVFLLAVFAVAAKKFLKLAQLIQRNSIVMICLILLLSYSSVSYTSVQLLKPLAVYGRITDKTEWYLYWSPSIHFAKEWRVLYVILAVFCEVIISIGLPLLLLFEKTLTSKLNLNLTRIKPILDQLQGCYKDEYRWFAAFYLLCRQVIYITDLVLDFLSSSVFFYQTSKQTIFLEISNIIIVIHVWCQPYKKKSLNILDSAILVILLFAIFASSSSNIVVRIILWFLPLVILLCHITYSTKLKYILIPVFCLGALTLWGLMLASPAADMQFVVLIIALVSLYYLIKCIRETYKSCRQQYSHGYLETNDNDECNRELFKRCDLMYCLLERCFIHALHTIYTYTS